MLRHFQEYNFLWKCLLLEIKCKNFRASSSLPFKSNKGRLFVCTFLWSRVFSFASSHRGSVIWQERSVIAGDYLNLPFLQDHSCGSLINKPYTDILCSQKAFVLVFNGDFRGRNACMSCGSHTLVSLHYNAVQFVFRSVAPFTGWGKGGGQLSSSRKKWPIFPQNFVNFCPFWAIFAYFR